MEWQVLVAAPGDQYLVHFFYRVAGVHNQYQPREALAFHEIVIQQDAQGLPSRSINFGEAITGQVRYTRLIGYLEQVDFPGAAWCFAGAGQFFLSGYHVEYAGFPGV